MISADRAAPIPGTEKTLIVNTNGGKVQDDQSLSQPHEKNSTRTTYVLLTDFCATLCKMAKPDAWCLGSGIPNENLQPAYNLPKHFAV